MIQVLGPRQAYNNISEQVEKVTKQAHSNIYLVNIKYYMYQIYNRDPATVERSLTLMFR